MPAVRSFYTVSILAACLAQVLAGGDGGNGGFGGGGNNWDNNNNNKGHQVDGNGNGGDNGGQGWDQWQQPPKNTPVQPVPQCETPQPIHITETVHVTMTIEKPIEKVVEKPTTIIKNVDSPPNTITEIKTITAAAPCTDKPVTATVTMWNNSPPGCWCGPPPAGGWPGAGGDGGWWPGLAPVVSGAVADNFKPGFSSIPFAQAIKTGVTVAAAAAAAPTGAPAQPQGPGGLPPGGVSISASTTA